MSVGTPQKNRTNTDVESARNVGVLYTGYLEKKNPVRGSFAKRFVVLTHEALHWFARREGDDLFGEERGRIGLNAILSVRILEEDANAFQVESVDQAKRLFRSASPIMCEEWVSAIKSTMKNLPEYQKKKVNFANNFRSYLEHDDATPEVKISLVSHCAVDKELVLSRDPDWDRLIHVKCFKPQDKLLISTSNSGIVTLTSDVFELRSEGAVDFEVAVQGVTLASSLRLTVQKAASAQNAKASRSSKAGSYSTSNSNSSGKSTFVSRLLALSSDRSQFAPLVLSTMVLLVGASIARDVTSSWSLFYLFAILHALYTMYIMLGSTGDGSDKGPVGIDYTLRIHAHSFTSPDAPINAPEDEIPQRLVLNFYIHIYCYCLSDCMHIYAYNTCLC